MTLTIEAPTDAQLGYIASLCESQGWTPPAAVASKAEASEIIDAMRASAYPFVDTYDDVPEALRPR